MWRSLWNWLIPDELRRNPERHRQAKRLIAFCLAMLVWVPGFAALYEFVLDATECAVVVVAAGITVLGIPIVQYFSKSPALAGNIMVLTASVTYSTLAYQTGGIWAPVCVWYVSVPILAVILVGVRSAVAWSLVSATILSIFYSVAVQGRELPPSLSHESLLLLQFTGIVGIVFCVLGLILVFKSLEKHTQQALERALDRAEAASRAKSQFLANMSHEIRTPMTAIMGFAENVLDPDVMQSERTTAVNTIRRNGAHLMEIINDILDLSKIEADRMDIESVCCNPAELVADVRSLMQVRADDKNLALEVAWKNAVPETIETDPTRLKQILVNLVGNGIKFTESGSVRIVVSYMANRLNPQLAFEVTDTGIGMTRAQMERLFQPFSQADSSTTRRFGGTGLGLVISRYLCGMLGGGISVKSRPGGGSTFRFTVAAKSAQGVRLIEPVQQQQPKQPQQPAPDRRRLPCRILLAEDGVDNQRLISFVLKKVGATVAIAENGRIALDLVRDSERQGVPFDLILMDMQMPVLDGYEAVRRLRADGCQIPVIALTAHAMVGDREKCLTAGCNGYATKPIERETLLDLIDQLWRRDSNSQAPPIAHTTASDS
jgi:signal transduction histidine kinase/ActR/RegA family two-component response regulator